MHKVFFLVWQRCRVRKGFLQFGTVAVCPGVFSSVALLLCAQGFSQFGTVAVCTGVFSSLALLLCAQGFSQFGTVAKCARFFSSLTVAQCSGFSSKCTRHTQHLS